jgi:tripartite-type tricarboxylate transporter receptor subunit TctC
MINRRTLALSAGGLLAMPGLLLAQVWQPTGPIRIVVPFPAGGTTDTLARLYAQRLSETMSVSVVVENRGGGGGSIGAEVVAKAPPDGQVLLFHNLTFSTTTAALGRLTQSNGTLPLSLSAPTCRCCCW